ncbi:MAG: hypothetical protein LBU84_17355 [Prevotella sp.]|nr:hypothetical protein [Prevotella sp.]
MKIYLTILIVLFISCNNKPDTKKMSYLYDGKETGLDSLLDLSGEFLTPNHAHHIVFYRDGLIAYPEMRPDRNFYTDEIWKTRIWTKYIWGKYIVEGKNIIKVQRFEDDGVFGSGPIKFIEETFRIVSPEKILMIESTHFATPREFVFSRVDNRPDSLDCWLLKEDWFMNTIKKDSEVN